MFPSVLQRFACAVSRGEHDLAEMIITAQHFEVSEEIENFIRGVIIPKADSNFIESGHIQPWPIPADARCCAEKITISFPDDVGLFFIVKRRGGQLSIILSGVDASWEICRITPGLSAIEFMPTSPSLTDQQNFDIQIIAYKCALFLTLLNEPRYVRRCDVSTRAERRRIKKKTGITVPGWHRVTWNIAGPVSAWRGQTDMRHGVALHFRRAHWRRANEGGPKAERRNCQSGWWCWVRESWAGHPAFGVRLHHYTPKLTVDAAEKIHLGAAGVAALRGAGHVSDGGDAPA